VSQLSSPPATAPLPKNHPFSPQVMKCTNLNHPGKKSRVIFDPANFGLSVPPPLLKVRGRECNLRSKAWWVHYILHIFIQKMSQSTHLLLCHHSCCSFKHSTLNWKWRVNQSHRWSLGRLIQIYYLQKLVNRGRRKGNFCDRWRRPI
jgi:hypothetical protein